MTCIEEGCPGHCSNGYYLNKKGTDATTINQQFKNANLPPCKSTSTCIIKRQGRRRRISHHFFKQKQAKQTTKPILDRMFSAKPDVGILIRAQQEWERQESAKKRRREDNAALSMAARTAKRAKTGSAPAARGGDE